MPGAAGIVTCDHLAGLGRPVVSGGLAGAVPAAVAVAKGACGGAAAVGDRVGGSPMGFRRPL